MSDIISFGEVRMESKSCDILLTKKKVKQAQIVVPTVQSRSIENIKLTEHKTINIQQQYIDGCCMLPDGKFAITDCNEQRVKVFNNKGSKYFEVKTPYPFDVVYNSEDNTLAVTSAGTHGITIIDMNGKQIKETISVDTISYGRALNNNQLIYSGSYIGIRLVNLFDESISDIVREKMLDGSYVATSNDKIYHTNEEANTVTCSNLKGEIQWTFQNESVLKNPRGIDVDGDGNMYVVGGSSNNVVVISPDGQRHREILTKGDGLDSPVSLSYSRTKDQLLVANFINKKAHLFNIV